MCKTNFTIFHMYANMSYKMFYGTKLAYRLNIKPLDLLLFHLSGYTFNLLTLPCTRTYAFCCNNGYTDVQFTKVPKEFLLDFVQEILKLPYDSFIHLRPDASFLVRCFGF